MNFLELRLFIFDMDGTLVDSFLDFDAMRNELSFPRGVPLLEYIESIRHKVSADEVDKYFKIIAHHELEGAKKSVLYPGARDFLTLLNERGIKTALLTRNSLPVTEFTCDMHELSFDRILTRDCVTRPKPDPEGLLTICQELDADPREACYMGDFLFDIEAAKNAGMPGISFLSSKDLEQNEELERVSHLAVRSYEELIMLLSASST